MKAYEEIKKEIIEDEVELQKYIEKNLKSIFKRIINAIELNTLDKVFVTQKIVEYE